MSSSFLMMLIVKNTWKKLCVMRYNGDMTEEDVRPYGGFKGMYLDLLRSDYFYLPLMYAALHLQRFQVQLCVSKFMYVCVCSSTPVN